MKTTTRTSHHPFTDVESPVPTRSPGPRREPMARIVMGSLAAGVLAALVLDLGVFAGAAESVITGATLVAFGAGWWTLAFLTPRFTSQPQSWARVPAVAMATTGLALLVFAPSDAAMTALGWAWPPVALGLAVWMLTRVRRAPARSSRWLLTPVVALLGVAAVGASIENVARAHDAHEYPAPGVVHDVGGHRLHLDCRGTGGPTVVLENGLGEMSTSWARVAPVVARGTRVCTHDRAGQGWSDAAAHPLDGVASARDLHTLLARAGETGPFVLVGHSTGGTFALTYADRYPDQVAGLVLLDSSSPDQMTVIPSFAGGYAVTRRGVALLPSLSRLGLGRLVPASSTLPGPAADRLDAYSSSVRGYRSVRDEQSVLPDVFAQAQALTTLNGKPLVVLTATENLTMRGWATAQDRLAALSTNSSHRVAHATHVGLLEDAHDAATSVDAITDVIASVRTGSPLATR